VKGEHEPQASASPYFPTQEVARSTHLRLVFTLHFFRALVTSLRALSQNKARFWLFYLLIKTADGNLFYVFESPSSLTFCDTFFETSSK